MAVEKAYQLGKKLGETAKEISPAEKEKALALRDWSRGQAMPDEGNHRVEVTKG